MSAHGSLHRFRLLIEKIDKNHKPSFTDLQEYLSEHDFNISQRTLQRDIEHIRFEFGIIIKYYRSNNYYYIDKENSRDVSGFLNFLKLAGTSEIFSEFFHGKKNPTEYISFESNQSLKGINNLQTLLTAIKNRRWIAFDYQKFTSNDTKEYRLMPLMLKEYQNRWYVIGIFRESNKLWTFGIDRIEKLTMMTEKFNRNSNIKPLEKFENVIGLNYSAEKPEIITISVTPLQAKYLNALPLHSTQTVEPKNSKETIVKIFVVPNYELIQKILMMGEEAKIISPPSLVKSVKGIVRRMAGRYGR